MALGWRRMRTPKIGADVLAQTDREECKGPGPINEKPLPPMKSWSVSLATFIILVLGVLIATHFASVREKDKLILSISERQKQFSALINLELEQLANALQRKAQRWHVSGNVSRDAWVDDASNLYEQFGYFQAIEWVDETYRVRWIVPLEGNEQALGLDLAFEPKRLATLERSKSTGIYAATDTIDLVQGGKGFLIFAPIGKGENFAGFILGVFRIESLFDKLIANTSYSDTRDDYLLVLVEHGRGVYFSKEESSLDEYRRGVLNPSPIVALGNSWAVEYCPNSDQFSGEMRQYPTALLLFGVTASALIAFLVMATLNLKNLNATLGSRIAEAKRDLIEKNRSLREFTYMASHDLQEPLRKLKSFTEMLTGDEELTADDRDYALQAIASGATRAQKMVQDLLAFSRADNQSIEFAHFDLTELVEEITDDLQDLMRRYQAQVDVSANVSLYGDRKLLQHVFQNLIENAIVYSRPKVPPQITIFVTSTDTDVQHIEVSDNGMGIDSEHLANIFRPFYRGGNSDTRGTGIGLAICTRIIERHGFRLTCESTPGKGSTFSFNLPYGPT